MKFSKLLCCLLKFVQMLSTALLFKGENLDHCMKNMVRVRVWLVAVNTLISFNVGVMMDSFIQFDMRK